MKREKNTLHRLPPCPSYDVEAMESWLTDMAEEGWLLQKDGFFGGFASFSRSAESTFVRYRLEPAKGKPGLWGDNGGDPDPEAIELNEAYGWTYVAARGEFHIYRSQKPGIRELNTDPKVQAYALDAAIKRQRSHLLFLLFWCILYPLARVRFGLMAAALCIPTWTGILLLVFGIWLFADPVLQLRHLRRLKKQLLAERPLNHRKDWAQQALLHYSRTGLSFVLTAAWIVLILCSLGTELNRTNEIPLAEFTKDPPFATVLDIAHSMEADGRFGDSGSGQNSPAQQQGGSAAFVHQLENFGVLNTVRFQKNWLSRGSWNWKEVARVTRNGQPAVEGCLTVEYHEAKAPWIAAWAMADLNRFERWQWSPWLKHIGTYKARPEDTEALQQKCHAAGLQLDFLTVFTDEYGFITVQLRKGCKLLSATFSAYSQNNATLLDWGFALAQSIQ